MCLSKIHFFLLCLVVKQSGSMSKHMSVAILVSLLCASYASLFRVGHNGDITISNAIHSTDATVFGLASMLATFCSLVHCHKRCTEQRVSVYIHVATLLLVASGLACVFSLKATNYCPDKESGVLVGLDGFIHYALAAIGTTLLFSCVHMNAKRGIRRASEACFGTLLLVSIAVCVCDQCNASHRHTKILMHGVALGENASLFMFLLFLWI